MNTLQRYFIRTNLFYFVVCLGVGVGLYLLSDIFDRIDEFLEAGLGFQELGVYFLVKIPLMVSLVAPAVFFFALLIQLGVMAGSRELLALQAGGVSMIGMTGWIVLYAMVVGTTQLLFSQTAGVGGDSAAKTIWLEQVKKKELDRNTVNNVWFREGPFVVGLGAMQPLKRAGRTVTVIRYDDRGEVVREIITAAEVKQDKSDWLLTETTRSKPQEFVFERRAELRLPIQRDLLSFRLVDPSLEPEMLSIFELSRVIDRLEAGGSNVVKLRTAFHMKLAEAFSVVALALAAVALYLYSSNIYRNIGLGAAALFMYHFIFSLGSTAGQNGLVPPSIAPWPANFLLISLSVLAILRAQGFGRRIFGFGVFRLFRLRGQR